MTTPEGFVEAELLRRLDLRPGRSRILLHQDVRVGPHTVGVHPVGWVDVSGGRVAVRLLDSTEAGRVARELLRLGVLDVDVEGDVVRLR